MGVEIGAPIVGVMVRVKSRAAMGTNARSTIIGTPTHPGGTFSKTVEQRRPFSVWRTRQYLWHAKMALPCCLPIVALHFVTGWPMFDFLILLFAMIFNFLEKQIWLFQGKYEYGKASDIFLHAFSFHASAE